MQVVKFIISFSIISTFLNECNAQQKDALLDYTIEAFQSKDSNSQITLESFHFMGSRDILPASFLVNNILLNEDITEKKTIQIRPGLFRIQALFPGKLENEIVVSAKKGDSISVKIYLKDDPEPLHPYPDIIGPNNN